MHSASRRRQRAAAALLSALAGLALSLSGAPVLTPSSANVAIAAPAQAAEPVTPCRDVVYLGARGSGQPYGLGDQVQSGYDELQSLLVSKGRTTAYHALTYPARGVPVNPAGWRAYFRGLDEGVEEGYAWVKRRVSDCPGERLVLAGYSQGAMVMHRLVRELLADRSREARLALGRIDGVLLVADGDRLRDDNTSNYGSSGADARGIGTYLTSLSGTGMRKLPANYRSTVHSVCNNRDPVCDSTGTPKDLLSTGVHTKYTGTRPLHAAVGAIVERIRMRPDPGYMTVSGRVGAPVRTQLTADVADGYILQWSVLPPAVMPVGMTLSTSGLVSGTSSMELRGETNVRVRAVVLGQAGPWVNTAIEWTVRAAPNPVDVPEWTSVPTALPAGIGSATPSSLDCVADGLCVGSALLDEQEHLLSVRDGEWSLEPLDVEADQWQRSAECTPGGTCFVHFDRFPRAGAGGDRLWRYTPAGGWSRVVLPRLPGIDPTGIIEIDSVDCTAGEVCVATGSWWRGQRWPEGDDETAVVWTYRGGVWSAGSVPLPTGTVLPAQPADDPAQVRVLAADCDDGGLCAVAGTYWFEDLDALAFRDRATFWAVYRGGKWTSQRAVWPSLPRKAQQLTEDPVISGLSCAGGGCAAISRYAPRGVGSLAPPTDPVLWVYGDGTWTSTRPRLPDGSVTSGSGSPNEQRERISLSGVACGTADACAVIGGSSGGPNLYPPYIWSLDGQAWSVAEPDLPADSEQNRGQTSVTSVACQTDGVCVAGGSQYLSHVSTEAFLWARSTHGTWQVTRAVGGPDEFSSAHVSCAEQFCAAQVEEGGSDGTGRYGLGSFFDGDWSVRTVRPPAGSTWVELGSGACAPDACVVTERHGVGYDARHAWWRLS